MILDEIVLHNFGVYGGRQSITLTPVSDEQPIVVFGGLNGGGKTTLIDALQLCLYGSAAPTASRNGSAYEEYLRRCIHRGAETPEAALELSFRHTANGRQHTYRLHRSWRAPRGGGFKETFEVLKDGAIDRLATASWAEQVEEFIPARIANLFLFDGEKVETYADLEGAPDLIATAIHNLLGLDIVERLGADLTVLERRKRTETGAARGASPADDLQAKIEGLERERTRLLAEHSAAMHPLDRARGALTDLEARYRREGGDLYERRAALDSAAASTARELLAAERELREVASGAAPLLMAADLLADANRRNRFEQDILRSREMARALEDEHAALLQLPPLRALAPSEREELVAALGERRESHAELGRTDTALNLPAEGQALLTMLAEVEAPALHRKLKALLRRAGQLRHARDEAQAALAAAPHEDRLAGLIQARAAAREAVSTLEADHRRREADIAALDRELAAQRERQARLAEAFAKARFEAEDAQRLVRNAQRVKQTLLRFREAVVAKHVARIERLVFESFQRLIRKPELVTDLTIDPTTFRLALTGADGKPLAVDRLSAGERQLLAVAILWGLAKASGRPLPTVIDTPLGRLDSHHRARLVERYFPHASHQVVLLSTDEEIAGEYLEALKPWIGRSYHLQFDQALGRTIVTEGYLEPKALAHVA